MDNALASRSRWPGLGIGHDSQPSSRAEPEQNGQCEEDKLPRTGPKESRQRYGLKLKVTFTVASLPEALVIFSFARN
jgi:hypothetical protein